MIAMVTATLGAFWLLLGHRYSPESYNSYPITLDTVEFVWLGIALSVAVFTFVNLIRRREKWPDFVWPTMPVTIVSLVIIAKASVGSPLQCYDMVLYCAAFGWAVVSWTGKFSPALSGGIAAETRGVGLFAVAVWMCVALLGLYFIWQQVWYWNNLALGYPDCGSMASIIYNSVNNPRELLLSVNPDQPMFCDHFDPGVLVFMPLWLLWPDFKMIIVLQVVLIVGVTLPLYWIGQHVFQEKIAALLLVLAWLSHPSTSQFIYSASYGFHWGNVCVPLYFFALALWMRDCKSWAMLAVIWALLMKEEAAIVIGMFGLYLAIFERRRSLGVAITAFAFGYFLIVTTLVIPPAKLGYYDQMRFFADLGQNMWEILLSPLIKPRIFWGRLFEVRSWYFAAVLLAPLLFIPLKKPSILFVGSLTFVFDCMHPIMKSISYHYQSALLPVVFWSLAIALERKGVTERRAALTGVVTSGVMLSLFLGNTFWSKDTIPIHVSPGRLALVQRVGQEIKESDSVFATQRIAAHFIKQRYLYTDPHVPASIDYAFLDLQDLWRTVNLDWLRHLRDLQRQVEGIPGLHLVTAEDGLLLYSRRGPELDTRHLVERDALPKTVPSRHIELGYGVKTEGFTIAPIPSPNDRGSDIVRVTTYSTVVTHTNTDLAVRCAVQIDGGTQGPDSYVSPFKPLGQGIWPIARWETNKFYRDDFLIPLPKGLTTRITRVSFEAAPVKKEGQER